MDRTHITDLAGLDAERDGWDDLYRADPLAQSFLSWNWLHAALPVVRQRWRILVLREGDRLVGALPLAVRAIPSPLFPVASELTFATDPIADYQGMLCRPGRESDAARVFGDEIRALRWDRAAFGDVIDPRFDLVLAHLGVHAQSAQAGETRCLSIALPTDWETYARSINRNTRQQNARRLRRLEELPGYRFTVAGDADVDAHVEALLLMNHQRWGGSLPRARKKYGRLFAAAQRTGSLRLLSMRAGDRPIAACASFVDPVRGTYGFYQSGYDAAFAQYSPGNVLVSLSIRDAIENGYRVFDFLRGDEPYKHAYASTVTLTRDHRVTRRNVRAALFGAVQPTYRAIKVAAVRVVYGPGRTV